MISAKRFGLAGGIFWGAVMFLVTIYSLLTGYGRTFLDFSGNLYPGYTVSYLGAIIGLLLGFIEGFVTLFVIAWLYNKMK